MLKIFNLCLSTFTGIPPHPSPSPLPFTSPLSIPSSLLPSIPPSPSPCPFLSLFVLTLYSSLSPLLPLHPSLLQVSGVLEVVFLSFLAVDLLLRLIWLQPQNFIRHKRTVLTVRTHSPPLSLLFPPLLSSPLLLSPPPLPLLSSPLLPSPLLPSPPLPSLLLSFPHLACSLLSSLQTIILVVMFAEAITVLIRHQSHFRITRSLRPIFFIDSYLMREVRR